MVAHLKHLKEHGETGFLKQAVGYLKLHASEIPFSVDAVISEVHNTNVESSGAMCIRRMSGIKRSKFRCTEFTLCLRQQLQPKHLQRFVNGRYKCT